jgi:membrane carboxypeptidase/penicillin-binding protein
MAKRRVSSRLASDEITTHGYKILTSVKCTTIMIAELAVTSGLGSSLD